MGVGCVCGNGMVAVTYNGTGICDVAAIGVSSAQIPTEDKLKN